MPTRRTNVIASLLIAACSFQTTLQCSFSVVRSSMMVYRSFTTRPIFLQEMPMTVTTQRLAPREFEKSSSVNELWYTRCPVPTASGIALDLGLLRDEFATSGIVLRSIRDSEDPRVNI